MGNKRKRVHTPDSAYQTKGEHTDYSSGEKPKRKPMNVVPLSSDNESEEKS